MYRDLHIAVASLLLSGLVGFAAHAQTPSVSWSALFGGAVDAPIDLALDGSGNIYATGGFSDWLTNKYSPSGDLVWSRTLAVSSNTDQAAALAVDQSANLVIAGSANTDPRTTGWVAKYDTSGNLLWNRQFGEDRTVTCAFPCFTYYETDFLENGGVAVDTSGNIYVLGVRRTTNLTYGTQGLLLIKYSPSGSEIWRVLYAGGEKDQDITFRDGYLYLASTLPVGSSGLAFRTRKVDTNGTGIWTRDYNNNATDSPHSIAADASGYIYVNGYSYPPSSTNLNFRTIKYDSAGNLIWNVVYDASSYDWGRGVAVDSFGNVYLAGNSYNGSNDDVRVVKYDSSGALMWSVVNDLGGNEWGFGVALDGSGGLYVSSVGSIFDSTPTGGRVTKYVQCTPDCTGRVCGPDTNCGVSCGTCSGSQTCNASGQCVSSTSGACQISPASITVGNPTDFSLSFDWELPATGWFCSWSKTSGPDPAFSWSGTTLAACQAIQSYTHTVPGTYTYACTIQRTE